ncbi:MAG: hypothetical protein IT555_13260 [Acetobacteraceae bacterium]|nr:hypothetical protein [Acetobacteraceae bacterium]
MLALPSLRLLRLMAACACALLVQPAAAQQPAGRIAEASGPVSVRGAGGWAAAPRGAVFAEGQTLRTGPRSQAELELGANRIGLDPDTVLRIDSANPAGPAATLEQGRAMLLLRSLLPGQIARLATPRGTVSLVQPGLYVIAAGDQSRPTTIGVSRGMAQVYGPGVSMMVAAGQTGVVGGADGRPASLRAGVADGFLADDPSAPSLPPGALPQVVYPPLSPPQYAPQGAPEAYDPRDAVADLPGGDALLRDGSWASVPEYGPVWYPPVAPGWSPYADPWADDRPWGYAPWYYGTWIMIGPRWAWQPPPRYRGGPPRGHAYRPGRPPPALAQPNRLPPRFAGRPPHGYGGGRPPGPPPVAAPLPPPAAPHVYNPRPAPPSAYAPPVFAVPQQQRPGYGRPPGGPPQVSTPYRAPPQIAPPQVAPPQAAPPRSAPPPAAPHVYAPRPQPPAFAPRAAPPQAAPSRPVGPSQRRCGPPGSAC